MISVSYSHGISLGKTEMQNAIEKMGSIAHPILFATALCLLFVSVNLILPIFLQHKTWLTPVSAIFLAILLLISIVFHVKYREKPKIFASLTLFFISIFVAYGRYLIVPY
jgi:uncharacterized membrane protein YjjP (DUF1212 family)